MKADFSGKRFLAWLWLKITGNLPPEELNLSTQQGQFPPQPQFQQRHTAQTTQHSTGRAHQARQQQPRRRIWATIVWILSFGMLRQVLTDVNRWSRSASGLWNRYSSGTGQGARHGRGEPVGTRTLSQGTQGRSRHEPTAPQDIDEDENEPPPPYEEAMQQGAAPTNAGRKHAGPTNRSTSWSQYFLVPVVMLFSLVRSSAVSQSL
jgi:hypothetical protein